MTSRPLLHVVEYAPAPPGCPVRLPGQMSPARYEWNPLSPDAADVSPTQTYVFRATLDELQFDFYEKSRIVSDRTLELCREQGVDARTVPLSILLKNGQPTAKDYHFLLLRQHLDVLDRAASAFTDAVDPRRGQPQANKLYPGSPMYDRIDRFVPRQDIDYPPLFVARETSRLVCTDAFRQQCQDRGLLGFGFRAIDDTYAYDPFENLA